MHLRTLVLGVALATSLSGATALASADAATSHDATRTAKAGAYRVSATVNKTEQLLNKKVKIKGIVSPQSAGAMVTLQVSTRTARSGRRSTTSGSTRPAGSTSRTGSAAFAPASTAW